MRLSCDTLFIINLDPMPKHFISTPQFTDCVNKQIVYQNKFTIDLLLLLKLLL